MKKYQSGFSMVELMVGTVISLLVTLTVAGSAQFLNTQQRITVGTNGVLENLAISYREVANDIKMAGYGVSRCTNIIYTIGGTVTTVTQPFFINSTNTNSDEIVSLYGESNTGSSYSFSTASTTGGSIITTYAGQIANGNTGTISDGSLIVVKQPKNSGISPNCTIYALKSVAVNTGVTTATLDNTINGLVWSSDTSITAISYPINSMIFGLSYIKNISMKVVNNTLQEVDSFRLNSSGTAIVNQISENIVLFKAYYGLNDGTFVPATGTWETASLTTETTARIRSVRVFLVARSPVLNKKNTAGKCDATDNDHKVIISWKGLNADGSANSDLDGPTLDVSTLTDGQCYKYTKSDFIVPLRNKVLSDLNTGV